VRALGVLVLFTFAACGGTPARSADPEAHGAEAQKAAPAQDKGDGEDAPPDPLDAPPPADAVDSAVEKLRKATTGDLPALVDGMDPAAVRDALKELRKDEPAYGWAALRVGRAMAHARRFREAEEVLAAADGAGPAAEPIKATLARLRARQHVEANRIGVVLPLTGPFGAIGQSALTAIRLAIPADADVKLVVEDTQGDADRAAQAVEKLALQDGVAAVLGPVGTFESEAAALAAERVEVPIMVLSASEGLTDIGPFVFRHRVTRADQARAIARYAVDDLGLRRFAILYPDSDYGREMMKAFWQTVEAGGGQVNGAEAYSLQFNDFHTPIKKLIGRYHLDARSPDAHWAMLNRKARDPAQHYAPVIDFDAIFIPDGGNRARSALNFLNYWDVELKTATEPDNFLLRKKYGGELPPLVQVLGGSGFNDPRLVERAGALMQGSVFVDVGFAETETAAAFTKAYEEKAGHGPDPLAAHAYDAARMVAGVVRGQTDREAVRRALSDVHGFDGVLGASDVRGDRSVAVPLRILTVQADGTIAPREAVGEAKPAAAEDRPSPP
jgi:ABC-type branched-subunit amino acid transport system substrate-binding protein